MELSKDMRARSIIFWLLLVKMSALTALCVLCSHESRRLAPSRVIICISPTSVAKRSAYLLSQMLDHSFSGLVATSA
jgi:hypothetical protein